jgi:hypothetical protein
MLIVFPTHGRDPAEFHRAGIKADEIAFKLKEHER